VEGVLVWEPVKEPYRVGYYCGLRDPDGNVVKFSYGQPQDPGAATGPRQLANHNEVQKTE